MLNHTPPLRVMEPEDSYNQPAFDWQGAQNDIDKAREVIIGLLSPTPTSRDEIIRLSGFPVPIAGAALLEMELCGELHVEPDGRVAMSMGI